MQSSRDAISLFVNSLDNDTVVSLINDLIVWHAGYKQTEGHSFVSAEVSAFS